jgi:hypothetical protein
MTGVKVLAKLLEGRPAFPLRELLGFALPLLTQIIIEPITGTAFSFGLC